MRTETIRHRQGSVFEAGPADADAGSQFFVQVFLDRYAGGYEGNGTIKVGFIAVELCFYGKWWRPTIQVSF